MNEKIEKILETTQQVLEELRDLKEMIDNNAISGSELSKVCSEKAKESNFTFQ